MRRYHKTKKYNKIKNKKINKNTKRLKSNKKYNIGRTRKQRGGNDEIQPLLTSNEWLFFNGIMCAASHSSKWNLVTMHLPYFTISFFRKIFWSILSIDNSIVWRYILSVLSLIVKSYLYSNINTREFLHSSIDK